MERFEDTLTFVGYASDERGWILRNGRGTRFYMAPEEVSRMIHTGVLWRGEVSGLWEGVITDPRSIRFIEKVRVGHDPFKLTEEELAAMTEDDLDFDLADIPTLSW
jgi:hypothetical protein